MLKIYLLQVKLVEAWHLPFHLLGGGPNPLSLKLADSGQIPVSNTPIMASLSLKCIIDTTFMVHQSQQMNKPC